MAFPPGFTPIDDEQDFPPGFIPDEPAVERQAEPESIGRQLWEGAKSFVTDPEFRKGATKHILTEEPETMVGAGTLGVMAAGAAGVPAGIAAALSAGVGLGAHALHRGSRYVAGKPQPPASLGETLDIAAGPALQYGAPYIAKGARALKLMAPEAKRVIGGAIGGLTASKYGPAHIPEGIALGAWRGPQVVDAGAKAIEVAGHGVERVAQGLRGKGGLRFATPQDPAMASAAEALRLKNLKAANTAQEFAINKSAKDAAATAARKAKDTRASQSAQYKVAEDARKAAAVERARVDAGVEAKPPSFGKSLSATTPEGGRQSMSTRFGAVEEAAAPPVGTPTPPKIVVAPPQPGLGPQYNILSGEHKGRTVSAQQLEDLGFPAPTGASTQAADRAAAIAHQAELKAARDASAAKPVSLGRAVKPAPAAAADANSDLRAILAKPADGRFENLTPGQQSALDAFRERRASVTAKPAGGEYGLTAQEARTLDPKNAGRLGTEAIADIEARVAARYGANPTKAELEEYNLLTKNNAALHDFMEGWIERAPSSRPTPEPPKQRPPAPTPATITDTHVEEQLGKYKEGGRSATDAEILARAGRDAPLAPHMAAPPLSDVGRGAAKWMQADMQNFPFVARTVNPATTGRVEGRTLVAPGAGGARIYNAIVGAGDQRISSASRVDVLRAIQNVIDGKPIKPGSLMDHVRGVAEELADGKHQNLMETPFLPAYGQADVPLPGLAGVRDVDVPAPTFEAPFSLNREPAARTGKQNALYFGKEK